jgi:hypothetical protein
MFEHICCVFSVSPILKQLHELTMVGELILKNVLEIFHNLLSVCFLNLF